MSSLKLRLFSVVFFALTIMISYTNCAGGGLTASNFSSSLETSNGMSDSEPGENGTDSEDADKEDQGEEFLHSLFTAQDLARWQLRSTQGPFKSNDDAFEGSPGEYDRLVNVAAKLETYQDEIVVQGSCVPLNSDDPSTMIRSGSFGRISVMQAAAFVDLVEGTNVYTKKIKELILAQAKEACMDFSNRELYPYYNKNGVWLYAEWAHRFLKTYDYVGRHNFSEEDRAIIDNWFKAAADWFDYTITDRSVDNLYSFRAPDPIQSIVDFSFWGNDGKGGQVYKESTKFHAPGAWINNRQMGIANFITHVGVMFDNEVWKNIGAQLVREYVSFHFDERGYYAELNRSNANTPHYGLAYGANTLINIAEMAHVLKESGYVDLFAYRARTTIDPETGDIIEGHVFKDIQWVMLKFRENFMLESSSSIYPLGNTEENLDQIIHVCKNTKPDAQQVVGRFYSVAALINLHYKNPKIKELYASERGNLCGIIANSQIRAGPHGVIPSALFMYAIMED